MLLIGWVSVCPAVLVSCIFASSLLVCHFDHDDGDGDENNENNDDSIDDYRDYNDDRFTMILMMTASNLMICQFSCLSDQHNRANIQQPRGSESILLSR